MSRKISIQLPKPYRSYREGYVYRNEKPGPGRFRQFMQFDADTVGSASPAADAEMCMMAADTMEALGIPRGSYVVKVNNRKVLDGVMESIGLGGEENAGKRLTVLRAIDKLDRLGEHGVRELLGEGRKDESGDFTKGAGLEEAQIARFETFVNARTGVQSPLFAYAGSRMRWKGSPTIPTERNVNTICAQDKGFASYSISGFASATEGLDELVEIAQSRRRCGLWNDRIIDRSLRRPRSRILHRPGLRG